MFDIHAPTAAMSHPHPAGQRSKLRICYATVSGTARLVAEAIGMAAEDQRSTTVELIDMQHAEITGVFDPAGPLLLLCIATTGAGDVPDDAQALYTDLLANPRYLGGLEYGLIALGDSSYGTTFCGGGLLFDAALQDLGARRIGDILQLDAVEETEPEQAAVRWFSEWKKTALPST